MSLNSKLQTALLATLVSGAVLTNGTLIAQNGSGDVAEIQTHLTYLGFNPSGIDGQVGGGTKAAIRLFQLKNGLPVTGKPGRRVKDALASQVNRKLTNEFGHPFRSTYGTTASCGIEGAALQINGLRVRHRPTWTDKTFDYTLVPDGGSRFKVVWEANNRLNGQFLQHDSNKNMFRVPELNMIALLPCDTGIGGNAAPTYEITTVPQVPASPLGSVTAELEALKLKLAEAEQLRADIVSRLDRRGGRFGSLRAQISSLEANLAKATQEAGDLRNRVRKLRAKQDRLQSQVTDLGIERDNLLAENNQLLQNRGTIDQGNGQRITRLKVRNAALVQENKQLREYIQQLGGNLNQQQNDGVKFQSRDGRFQFSFGGR